MNLDLECNLCDAGVRHQTWSGGRVVDPCTGWIGATTVVVEPENILAAKRMREDLLRDNPFEDRIIGAELFDDPKPGHVEPPCYHVKYSDSTPCRECIALAEPVPLAQERKGGKYTPVEQADGDGKCDEPDCACQDEEPSSRYGWDQSHTEVADYSKSVDPPPWDLGRKEDHKQEKYSLIKQEFLAELARVMDYGANTKSYGRGNWEKGFAWSKSYDAMLRHIEAFRAGERFDSDSDFHPLAHAAAHLMFLFTYSNDEQYAHFDDL